MLYMLINSEPTLCHLALSRKYDHPHETCGMTHVLHSWYQCRPLCVFACAHINLLPILSISETTLPK